MTSSTSGDGTTGADDSGLPPPVDVPDNGYCVGVGNWDPAWAQLELDVLALVNEVRAQGVDCHSKGVFAATGPLKMDPALRCAARKHSADMAARDFFNHTNPDGESPWDRMGKAGYGGYSNAGENIAAGSPGAQGTMDQWLGSDGHCANIMSPGFQDIGVGYSTGGQYGHLWTQVFGAK
ncbi:MAG: CAP domain-containing protein [Nannocystis sp.]|nr:CAP domain-containing protein [Nannocystis sp.]